MLSRFGKLVDLLVEHFNHKISDLINSASKVSTISNSNYKKKQKKLKSG